MAMLALQQMAGCQPCPRGCASPPAETLRRSYLQEIAYTGIRRLKPPIVLIIYGLRIVNTAERNVTFALPKASLHINLREVDSPLQKLANQANAARPDRWHHEMCRQQQTMQKGYTGGRFKKLDQVRGSINRILTLQPMLQSRS
jgi:hypothetical protein